MHSPSAQPHVTSRVTKVSGASLMSPQTSEKRDSGQNILNCPLRIAARAAGIKISSSSAATQWVRTSNNLKNIGYVWFWYRGTLRPSWKMHIIVQGRGDVLQCRQKEMDIVFELISGPNPSNKISTWIFSIFMLLRTERTIPYLQHPEIKIFGVLWKIDFMEFDAIEK
jgi:hypothetical protein